MLGPCRAISSYWLPAGALLFSGPRILARGMPRYFFTVTYADQEIDDPDGTILPRSRYRADRRLLDSISIFNS